MLFYHDDFIPNNNHFFIDYETTGGRTYPYRITYPQPQVTPCDSPTIEIDNDWPKELIGKWIKNIKEIKEDKSMQTLYRVFIVTEQGDIILKGGIVLAKSEEEAIFKLNIHQFLKEKFLELENVTILFESLGKVKIKEKEEVI